MCLVSLVLLHNFKPHLANDFIQVDSSQFKDFEDHAGYSRCSEMQTIRSILSAGEPTALIQREVLTLSDDKRRTLLDKAGFSSTIEIGVALGYATRRILKTMCFDYQHYDAAGSIRRNALKCFNCLYLCGAFSRPAGS